jgi:hypothetical protein
MPSDMWSSEVVAVAGSTVNNTYKYTFDGITWYSNTGNCKEDAILMNMYNSFTPELSPDSDPQYYATWYYTSR